MDPLAVANAALDRNLSWIRSADAKLPPVFAVDAAMLGVLGLRLPHIDQLSWIVVVTWGLAAAMLVMSLVFLGLVAFPRLTGPKESIVFFGTAAQMLEERYVERLVKSPSNQELLEDTARQAFRNAEIAAAKYLSLRRAMMALFASVPFWLFALVASRQF